MAKTKQLYKDFRDKTQGWEKHLPQSGAPRNISPSGVSMIMGTVRDQPELFGRNLSMISQQVGP